jgi:hypothetical protein
MDDAIDDATHAAFDALCEHLTSEAFEMTAKCALNDAITAWAEQYKQPESED